MDKGTVYWITGLAGSGKTTIGTTLYYKMKERFPTILLDGDMLKNIVNGGSVGYTKTDRLERAKRYSLLCKMLSDQGMNVIICTISMFNEVRKWNRENCAYYVEVFLNVPMEILRERNKKELYGTSSFQSGLPGVDYEAELPQNPDIVLNTDGSVPISDCVKKIMDVPLRKQKENDQEIVFWNKYYKENWSILNSPSPFAEEMLEFINRRRNNRKQYLLDLGCGNGRDTVFFAQNGIHTVGIDYSDVAIKTLEEIYKWDNIEFFCDDFSTAAVLFQREYDYCYSRLALYTIDENQESRLFLNVYKTLKRGGLFMLEVPMIHDVCYGCGESVGENAFIYEGRYRRFADPEKLVQKAMDLGFQIIYQKEGIDSVNVNDKESVLFQLVLQKGASCIIQV